MQCVQIQNIDKNELRELFAEALFDVLKTRFSEYSQTQPPAQTIPDKLLTKKEAAAYLKISLPTLTRYVKLGYVKAVTITGTRSRFRSSDLDKCLRGLRSR
ncbi:helix-turn-helix domain-containing protein [Pinibacter aurantiacus]|uniref:Excisionase family DNA-binding protein n=1 Tax=Pinibacter aurantiacus TaxID=2851599 RepID=A0A9E2W3I7_9BACT|nr:excisionase family DNA-binding protein [Pinibacter aurantiacus]